MTVAEWLAHAREDALRRGHPELVPLLEGLATSTTALRAAAWNDDAEGAREGVPQAMAPPGPPPPPVR